MEQVVTEAGKSFLLVELKDGEPTGWSHSYTDRQRAQAKADRLNGAEEETGSGKSYTVEEEQKESPFKVSYKKTIIGIAAEKVPLPGVKIAGKCPNCKKAYHIDLRDHYVIFPVVNTPFEYDAYCFDCDHEWKIPIFIELTVRTPTAMDIATARQLEEELEVLRSHKEKGPCFCQDCQDYVLSGGVIASEEEEEEEESTEVDGSDDEADDFSD